MMGLWIALVLVQLLHLSLDIHDLFGAHLRPRLDVAWGRLQPEVGVHLSMALLLLLGVLRWSAPWTGWVSLFAIGAPAVRLYAVATRQGLLDLLIRHDEVTATFLMGVVGQLVCLGGLNGLLLRGS